MGARQAYTGDERKYIKAIDDYTSKKITYSQFLDRTIPLKDVGRVKIRLLLQEKLQGFLWDIMIRVVKLKKIM